MYMRYSGNLLQHSVALPNAGMATITFVMSLIFLTITPQGESTAKYYASARIESCSGCTLNRLPDVKRFIFDDVPLYKNVEFKHIQGATPELVLFDENDEEVERLTLSRLTRKECNDLLISKGFAREHLKDEV